MSRTITFLFLIVAILIFLIIVTIPLIKHKKQPEKPLPTFSFARINNKTFSNANLENENSKTIFNFFSPNCEHCQYMATQYLKNKEQLKDINILMVTIADSNSVVKFSKDYRLNTLPNIVLLRDSKFQFYKIFGTATVPSFFIYKHQKLVKKIIGETKIENLIAPFNSSEEGK